MTKKPIAIFTGDNHLRPRTWLKHPDLYGDAYASWHEIISTCIIMRLPLILLGDLFDSERPDSLSVGHYLNDVAEMQRQGLPVYYIEGNHDRADPPWPSLTPYATPLGKVTIGGVNFYGISYCRADELPDALSHIPPETQVLLAHQAWREIQRVGDCQGSFGQIPHGLVMLTGDYHVCMTYSGTAANGQQVLAHSPGSTAMQDLSEPPAKYIGLLYNDLSVEWVQLETRPFIEIGCETVTDMDSLIDRISTGALLQGHKIPNHPDIRKPILRVKFDSAIPDAYDRLVAAAGDTYHLFPEPRHKINNQVVDVVALPEAATQTLRAALRTLAPNEGAYQLAIRLLDSPKLKEDIEAVFNELKQSAQATQAAAS